MSLHYPCSHHASSGRHLTCPCLLHFPSPYIRWQTQFFVPYPCSPHASCVRYIFISPLLPLPMHQVVGTCTCLLHSPSPCIRWHSGTCTCLLHFPSPCMWQALINWLKWTSHHLWISFLVYDCQNTRALEADDGIGMSVRNIKTFRLTSLSDMNQMITLLGLEMKGFNDAIIEYAKQNALSYKPDVPVSKPE